MFKFRKEGELVLAMVKVGRGLFEDINGADQVRRCFLVLDSSRKSLAVLDISLFAVKEIPFNTIHDVLGDAIDQYNGLKNTIRVDCRD